MAIMTFVLVVMVRTNIFAQTLSKDADVEENAIKETIQQYFNLKYDSYGKLYFQDGINDILLSNDNTDEEKIIIDTMIEYRKMQLEDLTYDKYELDLDIDIVNLNNNIATVNVIENAIINYNGFKGVNSKIQGLYNKIILNKKNGDWRISYIYYDDIIRDELIYYEEKTTNSLMYSEDCSNGMKSIQKAKMLRLNSAKRLLLSDAKQEAIEYKADIAKAKSEKVSAVNTYNVRTSLKEYKRELAAEYARNNVLKDTISGFDNYESLGGDCTNFVSACLYNGGIPMDYNGSSNTTKWYYKSSSNRVPSWTGAEAFHQYLLNNNNNSSSNTGLYATQTIRSALQEGDVVQNSKTTAGHSMIISKATFITGVAYKDHLICQRSTVKKGRLRDVPLSSKGYTAAAYYKINGYY